MTEIISYGGLALLLAGLPMGLAQWCGASRRTLGLCLSVMLAVFLIPWNSHSLVFYVRGVVGDVSAASLVLLCAILGRALMKPVNEHQLIRGQVGWVLLVALVPLYASTLGYLQYDLYAWGYEPQWLLPTMGLLLWWAWRTQPAFAIAWLIGVVSFASGMTLSRNLWDALFDPFMAFAAIGMVVSSVAKAILGKRAARPVAEAAELRRAA